MTAFSSYGWAIVLNALLAANLIAQTGSLQKADDVLPVIEGELIGMGGLLFAKIDLGEVPGDESHDFVLHLKNQSPIPVQFSGIKSSCNCTKVFPQEGIIDGNDSLDFKISIKPPSSTNLEFFGSSLKLVDDNHSEICTVNMVLKIKDNFLVLPTYHLQLEKSHATFRLPVSIASTLEPESFDIGIPEQHRESVRVSIETNKDGDHFLVAKVNPEMIESDWQSVNVLVSNGTLKRKTELQIFKTQPAQVLPRILQFKKPNLESKTDDEIVNSQIKVLKAKAMLKLSAELAKELSRDHLPQISCRIDEEECKVDIKRLSSKVFRLEVEFSPKTNKVLVASKSEWQITIGKHKEKLKSNCRFDF